MTATVEPSTTLPTNDTDPFSHEVLEDPLPLHAELRDAGPVVHLSKYDVYAFARYEQVHAALVDWQDFQSAAGVGLSNFRYEKPWRPPSLLLEADPPRHDAPRRVLKKILGPRSLRRLREPGSPTPRTSSTQVLAGGDRVRRGPRSLAEAFPLRVFPDAVGIAKRGPGEPAALRRPPVQRVRSRQRPGRQGGPADRASCPRWVNAQCARDALTDDGFGAQIWAAADRGDITPEQAPLVVRSLLLGRRGHHGARPVRRAVRLRDQPRAVAAAARAAVAGARRVRRGGALGVTGADLLPDGHRRRPGRRARRPRRQEDPHVPRGGQPRPAALGRPRLVRPVPRPLRVTSGSAWVSTSASASTSPGSRRRRCSPPWPGGYAASSSPARPCGTTTTPCAPGRASPSASACSGVSAAARGPGRAGLRRAAHHRCRHHRDVLIGSIIHPDRDEQHVTATAAAEVCC